MPVLGSRSPPRSSWVWPKCRSFRLGSASRRVRCLRPVGARVRRLVASGVRAWGDAKRNQEQDGVIRALMLMVLTAATHRQPGAIGWRRQTIEVNGAGLSSSSGEGAGCGITGGLREVLSTSTVVEGCCKMVSSVTEMVAPPGLRRFKSYRPCRQPGLRILVKVQGIDGVGRR